MFDATTVQGGCLADLVGNPERRTCTACVIANAT